jgi:hypothetical protein
VVIAGSSVLHTSVARSQRGLKRHALEKSAIDGTTPEISCNRRWPTAARDPSRGSEATSPRV